MLQRYILLFILYYLKNEEFIHLHFFAVRRLILERSTQTQANGFEQVEVRELQEQAEDVLQREEFRFGGAQPFVAQHLRVIIAAGFDHFAAVYRVQCPGNPATSSGAGPSPQRAIGDRPDSGSRDAGPGADFRRPSTRGGRYE